MSLPPRTLTIDDLSGVPAEDEERLRDWAAHVPEAVSWLREQSGLELDGSVESLRPLWAWGIGQIAQVDTLAETFAAQPPSWSQWRPYRDRTEKMRAYQVWFWGALSAYVGEVFMARATAPHLEWRILRHPTLSNGHNGELVVLRPAHIESGKPRNWFCPLVIVRNVISGQAAEPDPYHGPMVGHNDPERLRQLLLMHLRMLGEAVPELPPEPEPDTDPEGTLLELLEAPEVAAARAACPQWWVGLPEGLEEEHLRFTTEEVCFGVGFGDGEDGEWSLFLEDSIRPVVDVDISEDRDPLLQTLRAHPLVIWAEQTDREVYEWGTTGTPSREEMAALALTGLAAAQEQALYLAQLENGHIAGPPVPERPATSRPPTPSAEAAELEIPFKVSGRTIPS